MGKGTGVRTTEGERVHGIAHGDVHHTWRPKQPQSRRNRQDTWTTVTPPLAHRSNSRNHGQGQRTEGHGLRPGDRDDEERGRSPARPRAPSRARRTLWRRALLCYSAARPSLPPGRNRKLTKMECMVNYHLARVPFWNGKESVAMANAEKCAAHSPIPPSALCRVLAARASSCPLPPCQDP